MKKTKILLTLFIAFAISFWSCQQSQMPVESNSQVSSKPLNLVVDQAILSLDVLEVVGEKNVEIYNLKEEWDETLVTWYKRTAVDWTDEGGTYYSDPVVTATITSTGLFTVNIKELWKYGGPVNGIIIKVEDPVEVPVGLDYVLFSSREGDGMSPKLEINGTTLPITADAYIWEGHTDPRGVNPPRSKNLFVGHYNGLEKRTVLNFDLPEEEKTCETAYGWLDERSSCFIDGEEDDSGELISFKNWGWTTLLSPDEVYVFEVWAAAGQCDKDKGKQVGTATVDYDGTSVVVTYHLDPGFTIDESHVYAGIEPFPKNKNGKKHTVAPGQYEIKYGELGGDIYVIVHAVVCGDY